MSDCTALRELPEDLLVHGPIDLAGSGVQDLPKTLADRCRLAWRGMLVPPDVVFHPETLRPERILGERNVELRRVMMERVGIEHVLSKTEVIVVDQDIDTWRRKTTGTGDRLRATAPLFALPLPVHKQRISASSSAFSSYLSRGRGMAGRIRQSRRLPPAQGDLAGPSLHTVPGWTLAA